MKTERPMTLDVLTGMSPGRVRGNLAAFSVRYVLDWEKWLLVPPSERAWLFAATLRSWQATRPLRMRRCRAEATHDRPHIEDLLVEADRHLAVLGGLTVADLDHASPDQIAAHSTACGPLSLGCPRWVWRRAWALPRRSYSSRLGGSARRSIRPSETSSGLKRHLKSSEEWVEMLRLVGRDIRRLRATSWRLSTGGPRPVHPLRGRTAL